MAARLGAAALCESHGNRESIRNMGDGIERYPTEFTSDQVISL
jgi:hypothetical protein